MADAGKAPAHQQAASDATEAAQHSSSPQPGKSQEGLPPESAASTSQSGAPGADSSAAGSPQQGATPAQTSSGPSAFRDSHEEEQPPAPLTAEEAAEKAKAESMRTARLATLAEQADIRQAPVSRTAAHHAVGPVLARGLLFVGVHCSGSGCHHATYESCSNGMRTARQTTVAEREDIRLFRGAVVPQKALHFITWCLPQLGEYVLQLDWLDVLSSPR